MDVKKVDVEIRLSKTNFVALAGVAQFVGASSHAHNGFWFDPPSGTCRRQPIDVSLMLMFLSLSPPLSPHPFLYLEKKNIYIYIHI